MKDDSTTNIRGISPSGDGASAPENVVSNEKQMRVLYERLSTDHRRRIENYAKIQGQYFGNRPRDPEKLSKLGLAWMSNINNGRSRIELNKYFNSEFSLIHNVSSPVNIVVKKYGDSGNPNGKEIDSAISKSMSRRWKEVYLKWEDYFTNLDVLRLERLMYGFGVVIRKFDSWKFESISPENFLCPLSSMLLKGHLTKFCIIHKMTAFDLWDKYNNDAPNWDKSALGKILWQTSSEYRRNDDTTGDSWQNPVFKMQERIRNYRSAINEFYTDDINLVSVYTMEFGGGWSHGIIHQNITTESPLFFNDRQYDDLDDFLQVWPFEPGQRYLHSVRGLGYRIFQPVEAQNRLDNNLIDQAHLQGTVFLRTKAGRGKDIKSIKIVPSGINDIGEAEFQQQLNPANLDAQVGVVNHQEGILRKSSGFEQLDLDAQDIKGRTLGEVGVLATRDSVLNGPQSFFFYKLYDKFLNTTFRKIFYGKKDEFFNEWRRLVTGDLAKYEIKDIEKELFGGGEKSELTGLPVWFEVSATRSTSSGSQVADIFASTRMMQLAPFMTTDKRWLFLRRATAAFSSFEDAELYFPDEERPDVFTEPMQKAVIENALLKTGNEIPVSPNDSHRDECPVHFQECISIIQAWGANQLGAIQADDMLQQLYPHALAHYIALSQDKWSEAIFEGLGPQRGQIENQFRLINANAKQEREAIIREQEKKRLEMAEAEIQNDPKRLKVILEAETKAQAEIATQRRKDYANNLQNQAFLVKENLKNTMDVKGFAMEQARKNKETEAKLATNKSGKSSSK